MSPKMAALVTAAFQIRQAIRDAGANPPWHYRIMRRHRREWPTLWQRLDQLNAALAALEDDAKELDQR